MEQIERIRIKLHNLKIIDKDFKVFGSQTHQYDFNPVLSQEDITSFEKRHNVTLPNDYRAFLMEVGNGGAGPFYGLLSLEDNEDQITNLDFDFPFSFENPCLLEEEKFAEYDEKIENAQTDDEEEKWWKLKESLIDKEYLNAVKGITFLCHEGCCMFNVLVIKGKEHGTVWWFNFGDLKGVMPIILTGKQVSFLDWYEMWLDESLEFLENAKQPFSSYGKFTQTDKKTQ